MTVGDLDFTTPVPKFDGDAACAEVGGDSWFPEVGQAGTAAKAICRRCEVIDQCLTWALDNREPFGVWGGMSEWERRQLLRRKWRAA